MELLAVIDGAGGGRGPPYCQRALTLEEPVHACVLLGVCVGRGGGGEGIVAAFSGLLYEMPTLTPIECIGMILPRPHTSRVCPPVSYY